LGYGIQGPNAVVARLLSNSIKKRLYTPSNQTPRQSLDKLETIEFRKDYAKPFLGVLNQLLVDDEVSRPERTLP